MAARLAAVTVLLCIGSANRARAEEAIDEPGLQLPYDEPGLQHDSLTVVTASGPHAAAKHVFRFELGAGLSSLVVDPDVKAGYGGGFYLGYRYGRVGAELTVFLARNDYAGTLGDVGSTVLDAFIAGNITLGPTVRLTAEDSPLDLSLDFGLGTYPIANVIQQVVWTFGASGGLSLGYRVGSWLGIGVKVRYHLFNLTQFGGDAPIDRATLQQLGVVDRLEIPIYIGFYYR